MIVRNRRALVRAVKESRSHGTEALHEVLVEYIDGWKYPASDLVLWEREYPDRVRAFLYASQWSAVNKLATEQEHDLDEVQLISPWQSAVQVEDYQPFPVLKAMLMPRISMLLADDVGRGKTIEAGLILSELYARRFLSSKNFATLHSAACARALSCCHLCWIPSSVQRQPSTSPAPSRFFSR